MQDVVYHSAIVDLRNVIVRGEEYHEIIASLDSVWKLLSEKIDRKGSVWVLGRNAFDQELLPFLLDTAYRIESTTVFKLRNVFAVYNEQPYSSQKLLAAAHYLVAFLVKNPDDYYFDKDSIREPHVFKDIEWGKRTVGKSGYSKEEKPRYNPKGRDPGNVFYRTIRNGGGSVIAVNEYSDEEIFEKLIKVSTKQNGILASNLLDTWFRKLVDGLGRKLVFLEAPK